MVTSLLKSLYNYIHRPRPDHTLIPGAPPVDDYEDREKAELLIMLKNRVYKSELDIEIDSSHPKQVCYLANRKESLRVRLSLIVVGSVRMSVSKSHVQVYEAEVTENGQPNLYKAYLSFVQDLVSGKQEVPNKKVLTIVSGTQE